MVDELALITPHFPVLSSFQAKGNSTMVDTLRKPPRVPAEAPFGPVPPPPDWQDLVGQAQQVFDKVKEGGKCVGEDSEAAVQLKELLPQWFKQANTELADIMGLDPKRLEHLGKPMRTVKQTLSSALSLDREHKPLPSRALQWLAGRLVQIAVLTSMMAKADGTNRNHSKIPGVINHLIIGTRNMVAGRKFKRYFLQDAAMVDFAMSKMSGLKEWCASTTSSNSNFQPWAGTVSPRCSPVA